MTHEDIVNLTPAQVMAELSGGGGKPVGRAEVERRAAARRAEMFDRVCAAANLTPARMATLPLPDLAARVRAVAGEGSRIDESNLAAWAREYAEGKP